MQFPKQDLTHVFVTPGQDWPSDLIIAALKKAGFSVPVLEAELGIGAGSLRNAFYRHVSRYEHLIAQKIGLSPDVIWPNRYSADNRQSA
ncbi:helix-turn-helix domain-containing protein [Candidatus Erwinia dacicola]|uniref:Transcriptional regulator n=1 Tax=Candidatus Erwinia dacicola TaxID=252393 RepID=A0A1E7YYP4_9GAMM|nr:helix-turn-helix domain-containing protein [Candidatus Erwinia dacicola]NJD00362.1 transcriptional regulator [Candidatus Erwinia dacicola]NJD86148.1 transcriptional regulator [Candidatus Erwinia dacicola]OFC61622.1 transcriptional regulator [Candidatus Erwinia dacicola]RAP70017.1 winged helix-turn-helix DNA-binding family protein [Candidatus Erwinia dacicola]